MEFFVASMQGHYSVGSNRMEQVGSIRQPCKNTRIKQIGHLIVQRFAAYGLVSQIHATVCRGVEQALFPLIHCLDWRRGVYKPVPKRGER